MSVIAIITHEMSPKEKQGWIQKFKKLGESQTKAPYFYQAMCVITANKVINKVSSNVIPDR